MSQNSEFSEYTCVYTANGQLAGEMIRLLLESVNIPVILSQESAGAAMGLTMGSLGEAKIFVPIRYTQAAQKILREMEEGQLVTDLNLERLEMQKPAYKSNKLAERERVKERDL